MQELHHKRRLWGRQADNAAQARADGVAVRAHELCLRVLRFQAVRAVQVYDSQMDSWFSATDFPWPFFGHAGTIIGNEIYVLDGTTNSFSDRDWVYRGVIDPLDPAVIDWEFLGSHPWEASYRQGVSTLGNSVLLVGGTDNPYNFDGIGYDSNPSEPLDRVLAIDPSDFSTIPLVCTDTPLTPIMDLRGLIWNGSTDPANYRFWTVGGMTTGQQVTNKVQRLDAGMLISGAADWDLFE